MSSKIASKPLNQLIMLGSHDSGTYSFPCWPQLSSDAPSPWLALAPWAAVPVSECQNLNIIGQLNAGVRFFDLRIAKDKNSIETLCHGIFSVALSDAFSQVGAWLDAHPKEIVLLSATYIGTPGDSSHLEALIGTEKIANIGVEIQTMDLVSAYWALGKRCIILVNTPRALISSVWPNKQDTASLKASLDISIPINYADGRINVTQAVMTPTTSSIFTGGIPINYAAQVKVLIRGWLNSWLALGKKMNVVQFDFVSADLGLLIAGMN